MRTILFKGKSIAMDNKGEWIYGNFGKDIYPDCDEVDYYIGSQDYNKAGYSVDPETVGQYIGIVDKSYEKIFEGDILLDKKTGSYYRVAYDYNSLGFVFLDGLTEERIADIKATDVEMKMIVVGNVHDSIATIGKKS